MYGFNYPIGIRLSVGLSIYPVDRNRIIRLSDYRIWIGLGSGLSMRLTIYGRIRIVGFGWDYR